MSGPQTLTYLAVLAGPLGVLIMTVGVPICYFDKNKKDKNLPAKLALVGLLFMVAAPVGIGIATYQAATTQTALDLHETIPS